LGSDESATAAHECCDPRLFSVVLRRFKCGSELVFARRSAGNVHHTEIVGINTQHASFLRCCPEVLQMAHSKNYCSKGKDGRCPKEILSAVFQSQYCARVAMSGVETDIQDGGSSAAAMVGATDDNCFVSLLQREKCGCLKC
jgi:hypothetical protein